MQNIPLLDEPDSVSWKLETKGAFTTRSAYHTLFFGRELAPAAAELWSSWAPLDIKVFVWLAKGQSLDCRSAISAVASSSGGVPALRS